jgi:medium-chain acyl-[acyl-carrier-protein] hydrolase
MPPEVDFCPVELPGRAARLDEPPFTSMSALMEQLRDALQPLMAVPFAFFGHSVGAWMAYEAARRLLSIDGRLPIHLFVSGRGGPVRSAADPPPTGAQSDHDLLAVLRRFGGTPEAIMQRPEMIAALLPALRADLALVEGYAVDPGHRIPCPITAFGGADDLPIRAPSSPGEASPVEIFGPAHSPEDIFTSYLCRSPGQGDRWGLACIRRHRRDGYRTAVVTCSAASIGSASSRQRMAWLDVEDMRKPAASRARVDMYWDLCNLCRRGQRD